MALRKARPLDFRPTGCSDTVDASTAFPGAMAALTNLIPAPSTNNAFICRPASVELTSFSGFTTPGTVSALDIIGNIAYGMVGSARFSGKDEPFAYNLLTNTFLTLSGVTSARCPTTQPTTGDWTPPIIAQVGGRVVVTHPGFPGGTVKFGWFDITGSSFTMACTTTAGSPIVTSAQGLLAVQVGQTVTGTGVPANTVVLSTQPGPIQKMGCQVVLQDATHAFVVVPDGSGGLANTLGNTVTGTGIPASTTVSAVYDQNSVQITSASGLVTEYGVTLIFSGTNQFTLSQNATASASNTLTIAGGTTSAPLWGAGDTDITNLPSAPVGVAQMAGRAYFALGINGVVYSDSGFSCRVSNTIAIQALLPNDGVAVTALGALPLSSPLTGGIVQSIIAFQGAAEMQQITGDQTTSNLAMNKLNVATGTNAPNSICPTNFGLAFISPEGLRVVTYSGTVSDPIGDHGSGIAQPFIYALTPSRICAAANADTVRISVTNGFAPGTPVQEWWLDVTRKIWTGPHSFPASLIEPWANTFVMAPNGVTASLWQSDPISSAASSFIENGAQLTVNYKTALLPDNNDMAMNAVIESTIAAAVGSSITVNATDENGIVMVGSPATISPPTSSQVFGGAVFGTATFGAGGTYQQRAVYWTSVLVFKQMQIAITANSDSVLMLGPLRLKYQILGYQLQVPA